MNFVNFLLFFAKKSIKCNVFLEKIHSYTVFFEAKYIKNIKYPLYVDKCLLCFTSIYRKNDVNFFKNRRELITSAPKIYYLLVVFQNLL